MNKIEILKELKQLIQNRFADSVDKIILSGSQINGKAEPIQPTIFSSSLKMIMTGAQKMKF